MRKEIFKLKDTASINSVFLPGNASIQKQQYYKNERLEIGVEIGKRGT
jgi:hypothetical protein